MRIIEAQNLNFSYKDVYLIKNSNFCIEDGDFVCIVGENGRGKSTLLKLLLNILKPTSGTISINGGKISKDNSPISYVSQKATHFNYDFPATVEEVVYLGLYKMKLNKKERIILVDEALKKINMIEYKKSMVGNLSGGQQQRVFIAKALVSNPKIIFLDEPTTGIDRSNKENICCLLAELNKKFGITIVMVTHDYHLIKEHTNKIITINELKEVVELKEY